MCRQCYGSVPALGSESQTRVAPKQDETRVLWRRRAQSTATTPACATNGRQCTSNTQRTTTRTCIQKSTPARILSATASPTSYSSRHSISMFFSIHSVQLGSSDRLLCARCCTDWTSVFAFLVIC